MTQDLIFFLILVVIFVLLVTFELISHWPTPIGLKKLFSGSLIKNSERNLCFKWLRHFFLRFPTEFLIFACFCYCFYSHKTFCDALLSNYACQISRTYPWGITECFY